MTFYCQAKPHNDTFGHTSILGTLRLPVNPQSSVVAFNYLLLKKELC